MIMLNAVWMKAYGPKSQTPYVGFFIVLIFFFKYVGSMSVFSNKYFIFHTALIVGRSVRHTCKLS